MKMPPSAYYAWLQRPATADEKEDAELIELIKTAFAKSRAPDGARRLKLALFQRKITPGHKGLVWHTDRGSQYASESHRILLKQHGIRQSMDRKGNCWDNSVSESFFHTLKTGLIHRQTYPIKPATKPNQAVFEYIEVFYNRERLHSPNGYLSPIDYEVQLKTA